MAKYDKPDQPNLIWAVNALAGEVADPDSNGNIIGDGGTYNILDGWDQEKPPYQIENYSMNRLYQGFAYYNQLGYPEWDRNTEYQAGKSYVQASNNIIYRCIQTHINKNPATAGNEAFWEVFEGNRQATTAYRGTTKYATDNQARNGALDNVAVTPSGLLNGFLSSVLLQPKGYLEIPVNDSGTRRNVIVNWGAENNVSGGNVAVSVSFGKSFTNTVFYAASSIDTRGSGAAGTGSYSGAFVENITKTGMTVGNDPAEVTTTVNIKWLAIGY